MPASITSHWEASGLNRCSSSANSAGETRRPAPGCAASPCDAGTVTGNKSSYLLSEASPGFPVGAGPRSSPRRSGPVGAGPFVISRASHALAGHSWRRPPPSGREERGSSLTSADEVQRLGIERGGEDAAARGGRSRPHRGQPWHAQDPTECRRALLMWGARSTLPSRSWHPFRHLRQRAELGIRFIEGRPLQRSPFRLFGPCPKSQTARSSLPCPSAM